MRERRERQVWARKRESACVVGGEKRATKACSTDKGAVRKQQHALCVRHNCAEAAQCDAPFRVGVVKVFGNNHDEQVQDNKGREELKNNKVEVRLDGPEPLREAGARERTINNIVHDVLPVLPRRATEECDQRTSKVLKVRVSIVYFAKLDLSG